MGINEIIAEYEKEPDIKAELERARDDMQRLREKLGPDKYREWFLGHFINVEDL